MASRVTYSVPILLLHFILFFSNRIVAVETQEILLYSTPGSQGSRLTTYIIHVEAPPPHVGGDPEGREAWHRSFLPVHLLDSGEQRLLYSYEHVITGFAVRLTEEELAVVREMDGFLAAYPDELIPLQTTHSPEYLRLQTSGVWNDSNYGEGVIIGVLDTGINPDHPSFGCDLPPPPSTWKGQCEFGPNRCSTKIIGARGFTLGLRAMHADGLAGEISLGTAPFDTEGHGTHVASTAAGCFVDAAASYGQAQGTAVGVAPRAYISVYKVCGSNGCPSSDILAGLDTAISDGIHVASLSLGGPSSSFDANPVAIGGFKAVEKGIFVSCAAGNNGPSARTLSNEAPWLLTVGATTMDRSIRATVRLGNGLEFDGESLYQPSSPSTQRPLVAGGSCLRLVNIQGKVVLCDVTLNVRRTDQGVSVRNAGGAAMILANTAREGNTTLAEPHVLPVSHVSSHVGLAIKQYITSGSNPTATIVFKGTVTGGQFTPAVAYFSSRGPSISSPGILKPDIVAPGVNILAAWPTPVGTPDAQSSFFVISGTSMATPHVSGVAALAKAAHPTWSPGAIKSSLMTSASQVGNAGKRIEDHVGNPASRFDIGAGEVDARGAVDAGLVYEVSSSDYIAYLCGLGYTNRQIRIIAGRAVNCSSVISIKEDELNYPNFRIFLNDGNNFRREVTRTLTNLGPRGTTCIALNPELGPVSATVRPATLTFSSGEKKQYTVTFARSGSGTGFTVSGLLGWSCNGVSVRNAAVVTY
ncbi:unnamed protein product [Spirodela intermedia]|uniref:Uncharacterized protein n=1 Tax=Spirodela intermedia TaxID=51605 RepID=A0A7I8L9L6_SPIIN|nr:unnamed protein product [Spirodela intermedia]